MARISTTNYNGNWYYRDKDNRNQLGYVLQSSGTSLAHERTITRADIVKNVDRTIRPQPCLSYSTTVTERKIISGYVRFAVSSIITREYSGSSLAGLVAQNGIPSVVVISTALRNKAIQQLLEKIKGQDINLSQAIGEAGRTVALVAQTASTIHGVVQDCRKGNFGGAARRLGVAPKRRNSRKRPEEKEAHQAWLELQYGWKPLLSDVYGAAKEFADANTADPNRMWVKVTAQAKARDRIIASYSTGPTAYDFREDRRSLVRYVVYMKQNNPTLATAASLGFTNPLALAWEFVPFSFVADWFVPIGDYLNSLDAALGWDLLTGCSIEVGEATQHSPRWVGTHSSYRQGSIAGGSRNYKFVRTKLTDFPSSRLPRFKNPVSTTHMVNAIALLRGLFH